MKFYYFERQADGQTPAGVTVSKTATLPDGDFGVDEFYWGDVTLWFVTDQKVTEDERQAACEGLHYSPEMMELAKLR